MDPRGRAGFGQREMRGGGERGLFEAEGTAQVRREIGKVGCVWGPENSLC